MQNSPPGEIFVVRSILRINSEDISVDTSDPKFLSDFEFHAFDLFKVSYLTDPDWCLSLSRNLVSDAITFLLLAATHLTQTDNLPSLEVVVLWQSLPAAGNPLPSRADPQLQKTMQDTISTSQSGF